MKLLLAGWFCAVALGQTWVIQGVETTAPLRGVSAVDSKVVWASGGAGTYLVTADGGANWRAGKVPGAQSLDFRAIRAFDASTAYMLSIGDGAQSRIYKTTDAGANWKLLFTNPDEKGFLDELAFWDARRGIALGDPVNGEFSVFTTADGGEHWERQRTPRAVAGEGAFAASNSSLVVRAPGEVWFGTGGPSGARVFHSSDSGKTWTVTATPIRNDAAESGIFSLAFTDDGHGIAVGGNYSKATDDTKNIAITTDGGRTWTETIGSRPKGFRSAVAYLPDRQAWIASGPSGSDISTDGGVSWRNFDTGNFNALSFISSKAGWAVGPRGRIAAFRWQ